MPDKLAQKIYEFDVFQLDLARHCLRHDAGEIALSSKAFDVLKHLVENSRVVVSVRELFGEVWSYAKELTEEEQAEYVRQKISEIRQSHKRLSEIIVTRYKHGYLLEASVIEGAPSQLTASARADTSADLQSREVIAETHTEFVTNDDRHASSPTESAPSTDPIQTNDQVQAGSRLEESQYSAVEAPAEAGQPKVSAPEVATFEQWLWGGGKLLTAVLCLCVLLTLIISIDLSLKNIAQAKSSASLAQGLVILIAFIHSFLLRRARGFGVTRHHSVADLKRAGYEDLQDFQRDNDLPDLLEQYTTYWRLLLLSWVLLYAFIAISGFQGWDLEILIASGATKVLGIKLIIFNTLFNYANTLMIVLCFRVLNQNVDWSREGDQSGARKASSNVGVSVFVVANLLFAAFLLIAQLHGDSRSANLLTGIVAGIAMALFVGRLQSKFLGPRPWLLVALYSYTAIQPLFVYLEQKSQGAVLLMDLALVLKCLLYLYMAWLFQSGALLFYFARVRRTYQTVADQREAFRKLLT